MTGRRPVVALSVGDPGGIGPEIALRLLSIDDLPARVLLLADARALSRDRDLVPAAPALDRFPSVESFVASGAPFGLDAEADGAGQRLLGPHLPGRAQVTAAAGAASHAWVMRGADLALSGAVSALVTGPIHKEAWGAAGIASPGHTEALAERAGTPHVLMLMAGGPLRVALATIHVALSRVPSLLSRAGLLADMTLLHRELRSRFGLERPRIGVCGLNPHAGEGGRFGDEEVRIVAPAVGDARAAGILAEGPLPADACLPRAAKGAFDAVLALYHDQGLVAVKVLAPRTAVNVTLGLPFVRTSVDHGTAFDIAGRGVADPSSLLAALAMAVELSPRTSVSR